MDRIQCIAVTHLPGGGPVALTQRAGGILIYLSEEHDLVTIAEALTDAVRFVRADLVTLR